MRSYSSPYGYNSPYSLPGEAWTPANIASLQAWYKVLPTTCFIDAAGTVAAGHGDPVRVFKSLTPGMPDFVQATLANRPIMTLDGGVWWLTGNGTSQRMVATALPRLQDLSIWCVCRNNDATNDGSGNGDSTVFGREQLDATQARYAVGFQAAGTNRLYSTTHNTPSGLSSNITTANIAADAKVLLKSRLWNPGSTLNTSLETYTKALVSSNLSSVLYEGDQEFYLAFGNGAVPNYFEGKIGELIRFNAPVTGQDKTDLEEYLFDYWGSLL